MSDEMSLQTNWHGPFREPSSNDHYLDLQAARDALKASKLLPAVKVAGKLGEAALRAEVAKIGRVTGNLESSIGSQYGTTNRGVAYAEIGFFGPGSQHAHLVEFGTAVRTRSSKAVSSSWRTRGAWVGLGRYPDNFVTRAPNVGAMPALHPRENATRNAREAISASMVQSLESIGQKAMDAAMS